MKWFIPIVALTAATLLLLAAHSSLAEKNKAGVSCSYGDKKFSGQSQYEARRKAADYCMDNHLGQFDAASRSVPEGEQADMLVEDCVNNTLCK